MMNELNECPLCGEQMEMVGVNNILITPIIEVDGDSEEEGETQQKKFSRGLSMLDVNAIRTVLPIRSEVRPKNLLNILSLLIS